jgi:hypothetical protein
MVVTPKRWSLLRCCVDSAVHVRCGGVGGGCFALLMYYQSFFLVAPDVNARACARLGVCRPRRVLCRGTASTVVYGRRRRIAFLLIPLPPSSS